MNGFFSSHYTRNDQTVLMTGYSKTGESISFDSQRAISAGFLGSMKFFNDLKPKILLNGAKIEASILYHGVMSYWTSKTKTRHFFGGDETLSRRFKAEEKKTRN